MDKCNKDCLNCKLPECKYDKIIEKKYKIVKYSTNPLKNRLLEVLHKKGISQAKLSEAVYISAPTISGYVHGTRIPRADHLYVICKYLDISADWLMGLTD